MPKLIAEGADIRRQSRTIFNALRTTRCTLRLAHLSANTFGLRKMNSSVPAAAPATGPADLRDLANDSAEHHRLLPRSSSGRHPEPCAATTFPAFTHGRFGAPA